jgi:hypothetical protein
VAPSSGGHGAGGLSLFFTLRNVPWQQLIDAVDRVVGNARQDLAQVGLRIAAR